MQVTLEEGAEESNLIVSSVRFTTHLQRISIVLINRCYTRDLKSFQDNRVFHWLSRHESKGKHSLLIGLFIESSFVIG